MNPITQTEASVASGYTAAPNYDKTAKTSKEFQAYESSSARKTSKVTNGKTIGEPELSDKAKKYYDKLRKKFGNMDFILVSKEMKQQAEANAAKYANKDRMVVLIDEEKIEKMAEDEQFRKQYEGIISGATKQLSQIKDSLGVNAGSVKGYGMKVDDGGNSSFFAVIDKSLASQKARIDKKAEQKAENKKKEQKAAAKERTEKRRAEKADARRKSEKAKDPYDIRRPEKEDDTITVTADSVEELIRKINDTVFAQRSAYVRTDSELRLGQHFDSAI